MDNNQEILNRIAEALERISPNIDKKIDLSKSDGFVYDDSLKNLKPVEKISRVPIQLLKGLENQKEDLGQTLGAYGVKGGCYFVLPILGPTTVRDSIGLVVDSYLDPFAHITIREKELFNISGNNLDYYSVKGATAVDFRSNNITNFDSLEKNSLDLYSSFKSVYLQDRSNKIKNSPDNQDDWGNLEN